MSIRRGGQSKGIFFAEGVINKGSPALLPENLSFSVKRNYFIGARLSIILFIVAALFSAFAAEVNT